MFQQLAVSIVLWGVCLVITVDAGRNIKTNLFTGNNEYNSSPPPSQDFWLYQGDIKLTEHQNDMLEVPKKNGEEKLNSNRAFTQGKEEKTIWYGGVIPYVIDCSLKNMPGLVAIVKRAMKHWESKTCVTFVERDKEEDYVKIFRGTHCYSTVGRVSGQKVLSVGHGCEYHNVMLHEIGHVIGFWHEQSRPDRDDHIRVLWRNIRPGWETAFVKLNYKAVNTMLLPYDYSSIMHYPYNAFAKNSRKRTIVALKPVKARPYRKLSEFDILRANMLYSCSGQKSKDAKKDHEESSSISALRRKRRAVDVEEYKPPRRQRSVQCKNKDGDEACRYWAERGFCISRKDFMLIDCMKSCNACSTDEHYRTTQPPKDTVVTHAYSIEQIINDRERRKKRRDAKRKSRKELKQIYRKRNACKDKNKSCVYWSSRGFCQARPDFMLKLCKKSCNKCYPDPKDCVDRDSRCSSWAKYHYCTNKLYKTVMESFCTKTCGICISDQSACRDKEHGRCSKWREFGFCDSRDDEVREAMKTMCMKSCRACDLKSQLGGKTLCEDKFKTCLEWSKQGYCKRKEQFMNKYCRKSCKSCMAAANHYEDCLDNSVGCEGRKARGMCTKDRKIMFQHCRKTCGFCIKLNQNDDSRVQRGVPCLDKNTVCPRWASFGYCNNNYALYMIKNCKKSCGRCSGGSDSPFAIDVDEKKCDNVEDDDNCKHWARLGKCTSRPNLMISQCPKTCNACPSRAIRTKPEKPVGVHCLLSCKTWLEKGFCSRWRNRCRRTCLANACDSEALRPEGSCGNPMGAGWDYKLPDSAFNASTVLKSGNWDFGARNARLYKEDDSVYRRVGGWCAKESKNQWLQVDLGSVKVITAVATQGRDKFFEHVKSYQLGFSNDGKTFYTYKEKGRNRILQGNCDHFTPVINQLHRPYSARFIRFYPQTYNHVCMRVEIYGCNQLGGQAARSEYGKVVYPEKRKHN